jgi:hypothetical protein
LCFITGLLSIQELIDLTARHFHEPVRCGGSGNLTINHFTIPDYEMSDQVPEEVRAGGHDG